MFTVAQIKSHLTGLGHGGTLNKVRNIEEMFERSASTFLSKVHPIESQRTQPLSGTIHDDVYNYALASDFGILIDLIPQDNRTSWDKAYRTNAGVFDLNKAIRNRIVSIEGKNGSKFIRIDWRSRSGKILNSANSVTGNGTWTAVGTTTNIETDTIFKTSGSGSIRFDTAASGDGIQNTTMSVVDLTAEDEVADCFVWVYLPSTPTSITAVWGEDLTTKYWTSVAQTTQADGTSFKVGWNQIKFPWSTATETGTVDPASIDSFKITFAGSAMSNVRVDNIVFSIGRNFDCKYYSKYLFMNSAGAWISKPSSDDDYVVIDNDTLPMFLMECLTDMAHQVEGTDSAFDIQFAERKLATAYPAYRSIYPSQVKKNTSSYGSARPSRGRW